MRFFKTALVTIFVLFAISESLAQPDRGRQSRGNFSGDGSGFGMKAGMNMSTWSSDDLEGSEYKTGFGIGFFFNNVLANPQTAIRTEVLYLMKGAEQHDTYQYIGSYDRTDDNIFKVSMLSIAPFFVFNIVENPGNTIFLEAGPELGMVLSSVVEFESNWEDRNYYYNSSG